MRVFNAAPVDEEEKLVEVNARVIPKALKTKGAKKNFNANNPNTSGVVGKKRSLDPRFDQIYGSVNPNHVTERYAFLKEKASDENSERLDRMKKLRQAKRRFAEDFDEADEAREAAGGDAGGAGQYDAVFASDPVLRQIGQKISRQKAAANWDYDEDMGGDSDNEERPKDEVDEIVSKSSMRQVKEELLSLQDETSKYKQAVGQQKANDRMRKVKSRLAKAEVEAVRNNKKLQPYHLKRKDLKKEVEKERFIELEKKGGRKMVEAFAEKMKKKTRKHMD